MSSADYIKLSDGARLAFRLYDFTDPWKSASTVLLIHGNSESGLAWNRWVPALARSHRLLLPDVRGFGDSDAMPESYRWTPDILADDFVALLDAQKIERVHVIGCKIGGTIAMNLAARHADRVSSLVLLGSPVSGDEIIAQGSPIELVRREGVGAWAGRSMSARLGPTLPPEAHNWWTDYMGRTASSTQLGFMRDLANFDVRPLLQDIRCSTLVVAPQAATLLGSADDVARWQKTIPHSELLLVESGGYHIAIVAAEVLVPKVAAFLASQDGQQQV